MSAIAKDGRVVIRLQLNGAERQGETEPRTSLADFLRHTLGATGTHVGCEHGVCGACTVRVDGRAVRSCMLLAVQADGVRVDTVEGLAEADGTLSGLQTAFKTNHALQCGFCTAGILMSAAELLERDPNPSETTVRTVIAGHLCRCTGYTNIVNAVLAAARDTHTNKG